jgi:hypothetical protein
MSMVITAISFASSLSLAKQSMPSNLYLSLCGGERGDDASRYSLTMSVVMRVFVDSLVARTGGGETIES